MATNDMTHSQHVKVEIRPANDGRDSTMSPKLGFWGQLFRGRFLINVNFHEIEDVFIELIRSRFLNYSLSATPVSTPLGNSDEKTQKYKCLCHFLRSRQSTVAEQMVLEKKMYGYPKAETEAEFARLDYELIEAKSELNKLTQGTC